MESKMERIDALLKKKKHATNIFDLLHAFLSCRFLATGGRYFKTGKRFAACGDDRMRTVKARELYQFLEYTHYNVDARLVKRYFEQSADTIEWLEDMGVELNTGRIAGMEAAEYIENV